MKIQAKTIMIQGTGSHVGKSIVVTALCRILKQDGYRVCPFKSQNMALNSFVTSGGGEMGRAQVVQAEAAGLEPEVYMNPILIKPVADTKAQIIYMGKAVKNMTALEYDKNKSRYIKELEKTMTQLKNEFDVIVIEGAGSPAEINLLKNDIVNMRTAEFSESPVILAGDIDKGGVFASFFGTVKILPVKYRSYFKGLLINKFRGDRRLLVSGEKWIENKLNIPVLGVIPYYRDIMIEEEDSVNLERELAKKKDAAAGAGKSEKLKITVIYLPHISNFTDFNALEAEEAIELVYCRNAKDIAYFNPDIIIIPGSKSTMNDLVFLRKSGLEAEIKKRAKSGTVIIGICGGYQMLGRSIRDIFRSESSDFERIEGMELLDIETDFLKDKYTRQVNFNLNDKLISLLSRMDYHTYKNQGFNIPSPGMNGYEIHMGISKVVLPEKTGKLISPVFCIDKSKTMPGNDEGVFSYDIENGCVVLGTYIHGIFDNYPVRKLLFALVDFKKTIDRKIINPENSFGSYKIFKEKQYDKLADHFRKNMNMEQFYRILDKGL